MEKPIFFLNVSRNSKSNYLKILNLFRRNLHLFEILRNKKQSLTKVVSYGDEENE